MGIEEAEAEALQAVVDAIAQGGDDFALGEASGDHVVVVCEEAAEDCLGDDSGGDGSDGLEGGPGWGRGPTEREDRGTLAGIEGVANDIDREAEQLKAGEGQEEQGEAEED